MADHPLATIVRRLRGSTDTPDSDHQLLRRFADRRDEAAFAELVRRHGPTVWGVCRRGVPDPNDAEDVFQTTFLVLAKKPTAVGPGHSLGGWLHGVAVRASAQARRGIVRRLSHEAEAARRNGANASTSANMSNGWLDEELRNLPARYRDPLVLCHIRGLGVAEAANELGCPANTVKTRLARGREMLKERLIRRGITAPAGVLAIVVPAELSASTIQLATDPGAIVRPAVLALVSTTLNGGFSMRLKLLAAAIVLACGVALTGIAVSGPPAVAKPPDKVETPVKTDAPAAAEPVSLRGAVAEVNTTRKRTTLRITGEKADDAKHVGAFVVTVPATAELTRLADGKFVKATAEDLNNAARVEVIFDDSGVRESFPMQATAKAVRTLATKVHLRGPVTRGVKTRSFEMRGEKADDCKYDGDFVVTLTDKTVLVKRVNGKDDPCDMAAVKVGTRVEVEFFGDGVNLTDPPMSAAALVRVLPAKADPLEVAGKPGEEGPAVSSILIVEEGLHRKGVAKTQALSIIDKGPIARVMEEFPNALVRQKGSDVPGGWVAEYRVYLFLEDGKVVMLTVGAKGSIWTAPATTGDLKTNGDFLGLVKELSE